MTHQQERTVEALRRRILDLHQFEGKYEYKKFEVEEHNHGFVMVYAIVGRVNDEGTWNEVLGRNIHQLFIGVKGGMTAYEYKKTKTGKIRSTKIQGRKALYAYHS